MGILSYERRCAEIINQTDLLVSTLNDADLGIQVPSTPDWTLNQLLRHVGHAHRWADSMLRDRLPEIDFSRNGAQLLSSYEGERASVLIPWLREGAASLAEVLREVDPDEMIAPLNGHPGPRVWSRRMAHETVIHRWDVCNALGVPFSLDPEIAQDTLREWTGLALPYAFQRWPAETAALAGSGTVHLHATDAEAEFVIDLTGPSPVVEEGHAKASVALRGPVVDLVLAVYRRRTVDGLEVFGDADLLSLLLERVRF
ncbi:maleylpyruvate isomerase family mycothiol-dependent enzyme [Lentzea sp. BCCO 10_0798]|uniref:Maleylpyruvate isomerase family mycothiol-dependent enzyme n=1 Tax=Lentzea kristufekii TaxID=3095430 RepID=A0ABU4U7J9_9PSEU|nr:maleylpyruvate isomerase family mycothiol-dependent enzyme [Lentzea sp. BCCO 10_0798]MDX8056568.1 maleylpyruvate isomerase family mycothiol-dependent enzyme [Lentzea sp. BCCO 10_0798]